MASPRSVETDPKLYEMIYSCLKKSNKLVDSSVMKWVEGGFSKMSEYTEAVLKVKKADVVVVEVSGHSMSLGYLVGKSLEMNKPVVALYGEGNKLLFLKWMKNDKLIFCPYNKKNICSEMNLALKKAEKMVDVRFNFFISSSILSYLDWVASKRMLPRSVFLRNLIEKEMKKDKEYVAGV